MDAAQENRFVWLYMESDSNSWIDWAYKNNIEEKVIEFISTFSEYLHNVKEDENIKATPRSFERVSKSYSLYKNNIDSIPKSVFLNILKGNLGNKIAHEFMEFIQEENNPLISYEDVFETYELSEAIILKLKSESHTRLYLTAKNILNRLDNKELLNSDIVSLVSFLAYYPVDLRLGIMQEIKENHCTIYSLCLENEEFLETYFQAYTEIIG